MPVGPGSRLGPYEVTALIGEGGMGKVWRAHHTGLKRDDALKVLPDAFAADPDRLARFQREAQVLASLNHPNIAHVYGLEQSNGVQALVMELVDGPTLADRIAHGPIPVDEALPIAKQIAEALEAAHEQGIVHRDLKPANIKVRTDGTVKVLDFGLAKALEPLSGTHVDATASPTITSPAMMTGVGVLLGTAAYMSPEQARGRAVDKRSDIWAFGCVLYEMLTGQRAFEGEDASDTIANVLKREPNWASLSSTGVSAAIQLLIRRCLEKDRLQRVRDVSTLLFVIDEQATLAPAADTQERGRHRKIASIPMQRFVMIGTAALLLCGAVATAAVWVALRQPPARVERFGLTPTGASALTISGFSPDLAITADGSQIAYIGDNSRQLFIWTLGTLEPTAIARGNQLRSVFIAPDGQWIGFADEVTTLRKVAIAGGPPITLGILDGNPRGATWTPNDTIIFATNRPATGLQRVAAAGGDVTVLTKPDSARGEADHLWPEILPGGQAVLFTITPIAGGLESAKLAVLDLTTGAHKVLMQGGSHAHYIPTGHLVYAVGGTLRAIGFDLERHEMRGTPVPVIPRLVTNDVGAGEFSVAEDGTLVYVDLPGATSLTGRSLVWVNRRNVEEPLAAPLREYTYPRLSPDGTRLALTVGDQENDIWIWDFGRQTLTRLTDDPATDTNPLWTPDGRRVIFSSTRSGVANLYWQAADGRPLSMTLRHQGRVN